MWSVSVPFPYWFGRLTAAVLYALAARRLCSFRWSNYILAQVHLQIEKMLKIKTPVAKIAETLGKCRKTIYNEIKRGLCVQQTSEYEFIERYCADVAERRYQENLRAKGPDVKLGKDFDFAEYIEDQIINKRVPWCRPGTNQDRRTKI